jgi:methionine biosynthesis protein MetW
MLKKNNSYFSDIRWDIISLIPAGGNKILEIGCGTGITGKTLKEKNKAVEVIGIEKIANIAQQAEKNIDKVITADIEILELPFDDEYFDYVILADILEHLYNPSAVLNKLRKYIKKDGCIIASVPNIRYWKILIDLVLKGKWTYCSEGILDDTHLRFFTKKSIIELFQSAGFTVDTIAPRFKLQPKKYDNFLNNLTLRLLEEFWTMQYIIMAKNT